MGTTFAELKQVKAEGKKLSMLTAYDSSMARLYNDCGIDMLLVGDSLGMVMLGYESTVPVTMEQMIHHTAAVRRGAPGSFIVTDMPFGSHHTGVRDAQKNGVRLIKEGGCDAVKLEGGVEMCEVIEGLVSMGIPVMGHIGLTPQTANQLGGYKVQGKDVDKAKQMLQDAKALEEAGVFSLLMECVPDRLAQVITEMVSVPTIGIGAGVHCDGQVLVSHDLLGLFERFLPKFVKKYADLSPLIKDAVKQYDAEVKQSTYPAQEHGFSSDLDYRALLDD